MGEIVTLAAFKAHRIRRGVALQYRPTFDRNGADFVVTLRPYAERRVFSTYAAAQEWATAAFMQRWREDYRRRWQ